jgi:shikimate kinase
MHEHPRTRQRRPSAGTRRAGGPSVLLVGFMGAGKSTAGTALAERLHCPFEDLDERIARREGRTVPEMFRDSGEAHFRRAERAALRDSLDELFGGAKKVVALGGGAFAQIANVRLIEASGVATVFLDAPVEELWRRCCGQARHQGTQRPLLNSWDDFRKLYEIRRPRYLKAEHRIETGGKEVDAIVAEILEALGLDQNK